MPNDVCAWRNAYLFDNPLRRLFHNPERLLQPYISQGNTVLDVGCGMGFFSIGMARLVGNEGRVIAVDLQQEMLNVLTKRATRKGMIDRISPHNCEADNLGVSTMVNFILAFWMVHEVPDQARLLRQLSSVIIETGRLLIVEPRGHVSESAFEKTVALAGDSGWRDAGRIPIRLSRAAIFRTPSY